MRNELVSETLRGQHTRHPYSTEGPRQYSAVSPATSLLTGKLAAPVRQSQIYLCCSTSGQIASPLPQRSRKGRGVQDVSTLLIPEEPSNRMRLSLPTVQRTILPFCPYTLRNKTLRPHKPVCLPRSSRFEDLHLLATTCRPQRRASLCVCEYTRPSQDQMRAERVKTPGWPPQGGPRARRPAAQLAMAQGGTTPKQDTASRQLCPAG